MDPAKALTGNSYSHTLPPFRNPISAHVLIARSKMNLESKCNPCSDKPLEWSLVRLFACI